MPYAIGSSINTSKGRLVRVDVSQISRENPTALLVNRINTLQHGYNKLSDIINDPYWHGDPIKLERQGGKFAITDGRHRVHLAAENGFDAVWAIIS